MTRHNGMSPAVQRSLGYSTDRKSTAQHASCPKCGADLTFDTLRETAQTVEFCSGCGHRKVHRGRLTTE